jgi:DNA-binding IclR family transcriptional regulator
VTVDELMPGASGIAAAIFDRHARVVGACAIGGPTARVRPRLRSLAAEVSAAARAVSARLGHVQAAPSASMEASLRNGGRTRPVAAG